MFVFCFEFFFEKNNFGCISTPFIKLTRESRKQIKTLAGKFHYVS